jgi:hypothetical protein
MGRKSSRLATVQAPEVAHEKTFGIEIGNRGPSTLFPFSSAEGAGGLQNVVFDLRSRDMFEIEILNRFWPIHNAMPPVSTAGVYLRLSLQRRGERRPAANSLAQGLGLIKDENG